MKRIFSILIIGVIAANLAGAQIFGTTGSGSSTQTQSASPSFDFSTSSLGSSLSTSLSTQLPGMSNTAMLAMSSPEYLVTPGDVYSLAFSRSYHQENLALLVEGDGSINAGFLGRIQAAGMKFGELKDLLLKKITSAYPDSSPSLIIVSTGVFPVTIKGEVTAMTVESAWGLSRLSYILKPYWTPFSSQRNVTVISKDKTVKTYDLFKADRLGDLTQNPILRPGDVIEVKKAERIVEVAGAVRKPGSYELLSEEGVKELIQFYGDGALVSAKLDSVILTHKASPEKPDSESILFDFGSSSLPRLIDGDVVKLANLEDYLPVVYVEGAIQSGNVQMQETQGTQGPMKTTETKTPPAAASESFFAASPVLGDTYGIVRTVYRDGQLVSQVLRPLKQQIASHADLKNAYIVRGSERISINLEQVLYQYDASKDVSLTAGDRIVIPYGYASVYVKGEVKGAKVIEVKAVLRLSDALKDNLTDQSSLRDVVITSDDGKVVICDLFKAERSGDLSQNPLLRPGDMIEVKKASRIVQVEGEVERPGSYQLLAGEGVYELINYYGAGPSVSAKLDMAILTRKASAENPESENLVFDANGSALPEIANGDTVRLPSQEEYLPVVYIEGAIAADPASSSQGGSTQNAEAYNIRRAVFRKGELVSQVIKPLEEKLSPKADLRSAYIARGVDRLPVDLEKLLHFYSPNDDIALQPDDHIVIPYGLIMVSVKGEVKKAASLDVTPGLRLADALKDNLTDLSSVRDIAVTSQDGKVTAYDLFKADRFGDLSQNPLLRPGDVIEVKKAERLAQVQGEVQRPGKYQLLAGEGVRELVQSYADGFLPSAKRDALILTRRASVEQPDSESIVFDVNSDAPPDINNGDILIVQNQEEYLPVVYIEGAIASDQQTSKQSDSSQGSAEDYSIRRSPLRKGQLVSQIMKPLESKLLPKADLRNAYIARGTDRIAVNLEKLLHFYNPGDDVVLLPDDHIVVPFGLTYAYIKGEVKKASAVEVTSKSRLSEIIKDLTTNYSSLRDIRVTSLDGTVATYDVFKADRFGDMGQNPYIRPGDQVEIRKADRLVQVDGEVHRPGTYQLLAEEGAGELVQYYGDGALVGAKTDAIVLTRKASAENPESESIVFDIGGSDLPVLFDGDKVHLASRDDYLPVVYVEGALVSEQDPKAYTIQRTAFRKGLLVSQAVKPFEPKLSPNADLRRAYIARGTSRIPVDLEKLLYFYVRTDDVELQTEDRIVIPFGLNTVTVKGEVKQANVVALTAGLRLSDALKDNLTSYSSMRDIAVTSDDGKMSSYDLFKADRFGDLSQNPPLRPGDVIEVKKATRIVKVDGEVTRPGSYQLLENEGAAELVNFYGGGALVSAKTDTLVLIRKATAEQPESESIVFDLGAKTLPALQDGDTLSLVSRDEYLPVVYIEGAVAGDAVAMVTSSNASILDSGSSGAASGDTSPSTSSSASSTSSSTYSMLRVPYRKGMMLSLALRPIKDKILASADMTHAFVLRKGSEDQIMVDLEKLVYANDLSGDIVLQPEDKLVIPYGAMNVFVTGEVTKSSWVSITGLTRLRDVVAPLLTRYSSIRDVKVKTAEGFEKTYDLFKAERYGDLSQDPFLRPGDEIRLLPLKTLVTIQGEVKRPGMYQLLSGEGLKELVEVYADGFAVKANASRLTILHYLSDSSPVGEKLQLDYTKSSDIQLRPYDVVTVTSIQEFMPVVWFEGAVGVSASGASPETSQRVAYTYYPGETALEAAQTNRKLFSAVSDLANAYILHADGTKTPVNLAKFIYEYDLTGDVPLQPNDTFIVPFRQLFVSVSGAVRYPNRYPYIPDRTWEYYIGLAGGFDTDKNAGQKITIYDVQSHTVPQSGRMIQPEDNIVAASNSFTYKFYRISTIITTIVSVVALILSF
jgi:protein involved in polysaccharide export with SLBB domain